MADRLCEVRIADDLLNALLEKTCGSLRLLYVGLAKFESKARTQGRKEIDLKTWGSAAMFTGHAGGA